MFEVKHYKKKKKKKKKKERKQKRRREHTTYIVDECWFTRGTLDRGTFYLWFVITVIIIMIALADRLAFLKHRTLINYRPWKLFRVHCAISHGSAASGTHFLTPLFARQFPKDGYIVIRWKLKEFANTEVASVSSAVRLYRMMRGRIRCNGKPNYD